MMFMKTCQNMKTYGGKQGMQKWVKICNILSYFFLVNVLFGIVYLLTKKTYF